MNIAFYGGQTAGIVVLLTLVAKNSRIKYVFPEDKKIKKIAELFSLPVKKKSSLDEKKCIDKLKKNIDLFLCCHGRKILSKELVQSLTCINLHPCLYRYKGARPIKRLIKDNNAKASVAAHFMTEEVDQGKKILELFKTIENIASKTEAEVYNELYPLYVEVTLKVLRKIK